MPINENLALTFLLPFESLRRAQLFAPCGNLVVAYGSNSRGHNRESNDVDFSWAASLLSSLDTFARCRFAYLIFSRDGVRYVRLSSRKAPLFQILRRGSYCYGKRLTPRRVLSCINGSGFARTRSATARNRPALPGTSKN